MFSRESEYTIMIVTIWISLELILPHLILFCYHISPLNSISSRKLNNLCLKISLICGMKKTYSIQTFKQYRMSQVITELTLIIEFKRHVE